MRNYVRIPLVCLFVIRGLEFIREVPAYLRGERAGEKVDDAIIGRFYGRIILMHLSIIFGGFIAAKVGTMAPLIILVVAKTALDLRQMEQPQAVWFLHRGGRCADAAFASANGTARNNAQHHQQNEEPPA